MSPFQVSFLAIALATTAAAQTPPCFAQNDTTTVVSTATTSYGFAGENTFAWQLTPTASFAALGAQIYTDNTALTGSRFMILELWSDVGGQPGARLAGGAWRIKNARPVAWQGADLDAPVAIVANQPVWLVWIEPGFSRPPVEPGGVTAPMMSRSGTVWSILTPTAPKVRLFCSLLDATDVVPYGPACGQSNSTYASVYTNDAPQLGNTAFSFEMSGIPNGAATFVVLGFSPSFVSVPLAGLPTGCMQNTDAVATLLVFGGTGTTRGPTCHDYADVALALPGSPAYLGLLIAAQCAPYDAGAAAPIPFAPSNALRITLF